MLRIPESRVRIPRASVNMPGVRLLPSGAGPDAALLLGTRGIRAFGDGVVSVVFAAYLAAVGLSDLRIGVVVTATLLGSAALTLLVGLRAHHVARRRLLQLVSLLMIATGLGFAAVTSFWPLLIVAFLGTLNPSSGDVSVFLPTEQALLPGTAPDTQRTALFARYSLVGTLVAAIGALCAGVPEWLGDRAGVASTTALRWTFVGYAALGVAVLLRYRQLSPAIEPTGEAPPSALGTSRQVVYRLAALFSLDAFGGGFVITALLVLWLQRRFGLSIAVSGVVFFWAGVLSAFSALVAVRIAERIGLVRTMVFTHLPANGFLILAAFCRRRRSPWPPYSPARHCRRWTYRRAPPTSWPSCRPPSVRRRPASPTCPAASRPRCRLSRRAGCSATPRSAGRSSSAAPSRRPTTCCCCASFATSVHPRNPAHAVPVRLALAEREALSRRRHTHPRIAHVRAVEPRTQNVPDRRRAGATECRRASANPHRRLGRNHPLKRAHRLPAHIDPDRSRCQ